MNITPPAKPQDPNLSVNNNCTNKKITGVISFSLRPHVK